MLRFAGKVLLVTFLFFLGVAILCNISGMHSIGELSKGIEIASILALLVGGAVYLGGWATRRPARELSDQYASTTWRKDTPKREREEVRYLEGSLGFFMLMSIVSCLLYASSMLLNQLVPVDRTFEEGIEGTAIINLESQTQLSSLPTLPYPVPATFYLAFNVSKPPFDDVAIRCALALSIDKHALVSYLGGEGYLLPALLLVPPEIWPDGEYPPIDMPLSFDTEESVNIFASSQYVSENQFDWSEVVLAVPRFRQAEDSANFIRASWADVLGIALDDPIVVDPATYISYLDENTPHAYLLGWVADYNSPHNFLVGISEGVSQRTGWANTNYDALVSAAFEEDDLLRKVELYAEAEEILRAEEVIIVPLYHYYRSW